MISRYAAILLVPSRVSRVWSGVVLGHYKTRAAAERRIARLRPEEVTRYRSARLERMCEIRDVKTGQRYHAPHPTYLVPSVGDLGYSP